jgi:post-segregation antitoxin (ccd killing protein)
MRIMKLLNVRLQDQDVEVVKHLRSLGVEISEVVRKAIRTEAARLARRHSKLHGEALIKSIIARHPDENEKPYDLDITDRRQRQAYIREQLTRTRSR